MLVLKEGTTLDGKHYTTQYAKLCSDNPFSGDYLVTAGVSLAEIIFSSWFVRIRERFYSDHTE